MHCLTVALLGLARRAEVARVRVFVALIDIVVRGKRGWTNLANDDLIAMLPLRCNRRSDRPSDCRADDAPLLAAKL